MPKSVSADWGSFAMVPEWLLYSSASGNAIKLFAVLHRHEGDAGIYPSRSRLTELCGWSLPTTDRAIDELKDLGAITIHPRHSPNGGQSSNEYVLHGHPPVTTPLGTCDQPPLITGDQQTRAISNESTAAATATVIKEEGWVAAIRAWEEGTGTLITPFLSEAIQGAIEKYGLNWVLAAIKETAVSNVRAWKYTSAILARWQSEGRQPADRAPDANAPPPPKKPNLEPFDLEADTWWARQIRAEKEQGIT